MEHDTLDKYQDINKEEKYCEEIFNLIKLSIDLKDKEMIKILKDLFLNDNQDCNQLLNQIISRK